MANSGQVLIDRNTVTAQGISVPDPGLHQHPGRIDRTGGQDDFHAGRDLVDGAVAPYPHPGDSRP
jgi:hypothetical protein